MNEINQQTFEKSTTQWRGFNNSFVLVLVLLLVALVAGAGGYWIGERANQHLGKTQQPTAFQRLSVMPTFALSPMPTIDPTIANWKTYSSKFGGYTFRAPPQWFEDKRKDNSILNNYDIAIDIGLNANADPNVGPDDPQVAFITFDFPVTISEPHTHDDGAARYEQGLKGLESFTRWGKAQYVNYIRLEGRTVLVNKATTPVNPPTDLQADYCSGCTTKNVYIDLGNGKILHIEGYWGSARDEFESIFDKVVSTIHFIP